MSKKICFKVDFPYRNNKLFEKGRDLDIYYCLKEIFNFNGFEVGTNDLMKESDSDIVFYLDYRSDFIDSRCFKVLIAMESNAVIAKTFDKSYTDKFDLVFTFLDKIVDNKRIFKINYSFNLENEVGISFPDKTKFLCNFSSNKFSNHKNELYSRRIEAIEYYENLEENIFDLYGFGWDKSYPFPLIYNLVKRLHRFKLTRAFVKIFNKIPLKINPILKTYKCYKGPVNDKWEDLKRYEYCMCYENVSGVNGYITEKIFDCFKNGVVPIYLGPDNIEEIIPKEAFIDRRIYTSEEQVFNYITKIDEFKYQKYINAAKRFLNSDAANSFNSSITAEYISRKIITTCSNQKND
mgnify:CR=1 FL=1